MSQYTRLVQAGNDDGYSESPYGWSATGSGVWLGKSGASNTFTGGFRFTNVTVPKDAVISSAKITLIANGNTSSTNVNLIVYGIDEDNTGTMSSDPTGRTKTTAYAEWGPIGNLTNDTSVDSPDLKDIIQEIVNRAGWASGNAMGFLVPDNGSGAYNNHLFHTYESSTSKCALLTINYVAASASLSPSLSLSKSPSATLSESSSPSASPSITKSPSPSLSPSISASASISPSLSPSPTPLIPFFGLRIAKPGVNVLTVDDPRNLIFSSDYGTLKYYLKDTVDVVVKSNSTDLEIAGKTTYTHSLGYIPFVEVYMKTPSGVYIRCPAKMAGASVSFGGDFQIKKNTIDFYAWNSGFPGFSSNQIYKFIFFIFANNLSL